MKKNLIKKCAVAAAACAVMAAGVGYYYFFSSMSKDGETHYVYVDDDDNIDSVYTKLSDVSASHSPTPQATPRMCAQDVTPSSRQQEPCRRSAT